MVFRPDTYAPSILLMWADFAYFLAVFSVPLFGGWCVLIALPIFSPSRERAISALGGLCKLMGGFALCTGQMVIFFKDGPFSWHGIVAMYLPFIAFFAWIVIMSWVMIKIAHDENS